MDTSSVTVRNKQANSSSYSNLRHCYIMKQKTERDNQTAVKICCCRYTLILNKIVKLKTYPKTPHTMIPVCFSQSLSKEIKYETAKHPNKPTHLSNRSITRLISNPNLFLYGVTAQVQILSVSTRDLFQFLWMSDQLLTAVK